ncbi:MAG: 23S rRNA pseudouridine(1911/1915/1917) synthase RluD [Marinagarivorans sp.]
MRRRITLNHTVPYEASGQRFDQVSAQLFPQFSRARLQTWIKSGELTLNGQAFKGNGKLVGGEEVHLDVEVQDEGDWQAEAIALDVVYEDDTILVVNKAAGMVVHPAAGNSEGTLLNALLHHSPQLAAIPRAGIVHRLDKDTTGLMVVAKTLEAQNHLVSQLQAREVSRQYQAIVVGRVISGGTINLPIGRDSKHRKKMAVSKTGEGKEAITHYEVAERFSYFTRLCIKLETGRTHQIRVHMSHNRFPLVGDPAYGGGGKGLRSSVINEAVLEAVKAFPRQALHAEALSLIHPESQEPCHWQVPMPADMLELLTLMRCYD